MGSWAECHWSQALGLLLTPSALHPLRSLPSGWIWGPALIAHLTHISHFYGLDREVPGEDVVFSRLPRSGGSVCLP